MNVAIIGNSHLACVKAAWRSNVHVARFLGGSAGSGGLLKAWIRTDDPPALALSPSAHPTQRLLWTKCCGGEQPFALEEIDAFVFVGLMGSARPWRLSNCSLTGGVGGLADYGVPPTSFAQWRAMNAPLYHLDSQAHLVEMVRVAGAPERPILSIAAPAPRADAADYNARYVLPEEWRCLSPQLRSAMLLNERALVTRLGREVGLQVIHPPLALVVEDYFCPAEYSRGAMGSRNFVEKTPQYGDSPLEHVLNITHKNVAYGAILVEQIHRALAGLPTEFVPPAATGPLAANR